MEHTNDASDLVARARDGDESAVRSLMVQHLPSMMAYVRLQAGKLVSAKEGVSDLVQSACLEALNQLDGFEYRGEAEFRHWLCIQALRKIQGKHRYYKAQRRDAALERSPEDDGDTEDGGLAAVYATICTPSRHAVAREAMSAFERAFEELPEDYRDAITLSRVVGLSYAEIASRMDRSEGAVRNLVHRGVARLLMQLDES